MPGEWTGAAFAPHDHVGAGLIEVARQPARKRRSTAKANRARPRRLTLRCDPIVDQLKTRRTSDL